MKTFRKKVSLPIITNHSSHRKSLIQVWFDLVIGDINVSTGKAQLLIRERFNQFTKLISDCENRSSEKEIRLDDLQGFWEMIYFQVEDVLASFETLETIRKNDWKEVEPDPIPIKSADATKKPRLVTRKVPKYSNVKATFQRPKAQLKPVNLWHALLPPRPLVFQPQNVAPKPIILSKLQK